MNEVQARPAPARATRLDCAANAAARWIAVAILVINTLVLCNISNFNLPLYNIVLLSTCTTLSIIYNLRMIKIAHSQKETSKKVKVKKFQQNRATFIKIQTIVSLILIGGLIAANIFAMKNNLNFKQIGIMHLSVCVTLFASALIYNLCHQQSKRALYVKKPA